MEFFNKINRTAKGRKITREALYSVESVPEGVRYWRTKLLNYCLGILEYTGLPESTPWREVASNLILTGHAVFCRNDRTGELVVPITELAGYDEYYRPTYATFGNTLIPYKRLELGINAEVVYCNWIQGNILREQYPDSGLKSFIDRYARLLADVESALDAELINARDRVYMVAGSQAMAEQLRDFQRRAELGERAVISDEDILQAFRTVDASPAHQSEGIGDLLIARDKILSMFYRDIGIKMQQDQKRAQLTEDEVEADEQLLLINIEDMRAEQQEGFDRVNWLFGTDIQVRIRESRNRKEGERDFI